MADGPPVMDDPALVGSSFIILDRRDQLRLVLDRLPEGDALCAALACRRFRAALFARWPRLPDGHARDRSRPQETRPVRFRTSLLRDMASASVERFQWLLEMFPPDDGDACDASCRWLGGAAPEELARRLAEFGALETMRWLRARNGSVTMAVLRDVESWDASACTAAVENGHLDVLQWLRSEGVHTRPAPALCCTGKTHESPIQNAEFCILFDEISAQYVSSALPMAGGPLQRWPPPLTSLRDVSTRAAPPTRCDFTVDFRLVFRLVFE